VDAAGVVRAGGWLFVRDFGAAFDAVVRRSPREAAAVLDRMDAEAQGMISDESLAALLAAPDSAVRLRAIAALGARGAAEPAVRPEANTVRSATFAR
jgi:hypothetical protein